VSIAFTGPASGARTSQGAAGRWASIGVLDVAVILGGCPSKPNASSGDPDASTGTPDSEGISQPSATDTTPTSTSDGTPTTSTSTATTGAASTSTGDDPEATTLGDAPDSTSGAGTTGGMTATTTGGTTMTVEDTTTTDTTDTTDTTGEPGEPIVPELEAACSAHCQRFDECSTFPGEEAPLAECIKNCAFTFQECTEEPIAWYACLAGLSCADFNAFFHEFPDVMCLDEWNAAHDACVTCGYYYGGDQNTCSFGHGCGEEPEQEIVCTFAGECTCIDDGVPGKKCQIDGFCGQNDLDADAAAVKDCCGWDW